MKKLFIAAMMVLGLGFSIGSAFAATGWTYSHTPQQVHNGPDYSADSSDAP
jgi:hypothetical protein